MEIFVSDFHVTNIARREGMFIFTVVDFLYFEDFCSEEHKYSFTQIKVGKNTVINLINAISKTYESVKKDEDIDIYIHKGGGSYEGFCVCYSDNETISISMLGKGKEYTLLPLNIVLGNDPEELLRFRNLLEQVVSDA